MAYKSLVWQVGETKCVAFCVAVWGHLEPHLVFSFKSLTLWKNLVCAWLGETNQKQKQSQGSWLHCTLPARNTFSFIYLSARNKKWIPFRDEKSQCWTVKTKFIFRQPTRLRIAILYCVEMWGPVRKKRSCYPALFLKVMSYGPSWADHINSLFFTK